MGLAAVMGCDDGDPGPVGPAGAQGPPGPPGSTVEAPGPGLTMEVQSAEIGEDRRAVVRFTLTDAEGQGLTLGDLDGEPDFVLGWIQVVPESGLARYRSHFVADVEGEPFELDGMMQDPALASAQQAVRDSGGEFVELEPGLWQYTFGQAVPEGFDADATHTVGIWASRDGRETVANALFHFVPSGGDVSQLEQVASGDACNECHNDLAFHGGTRKDLGLCRICHTDQTTDPETGENLDFAHLVHKLHTGAELENQPYFVVGFRQGVHDYSELEFPQDTRNCVKCHREGADDAPQADHWRTTPTRLACASCHENVNFETGEGHSEGIQQFTDAFCSECHRSEQVVEFDNSVPGAHLLPYASSANPGLTLEITDVTGMTAGSQPVLSFSATDDGGPVDITTLDRVAVVFAGPTTDYAQDLDSNRLTIQGGGASGSFVEDAPGEYTYTPPEGFALPADATGAWSVGMEGRTGPIAVGSEEEEFGANNPVVHVDLEAGELGAGSPEPRRGVVDEAQCNQCHGDLLVHGNLRTEIEYCVLCHNPRATDEGQRPDIDPETNPPESVDLKYMIHRIHRGEDLQNPFVVYGFGNRAHQFNDVLYPRNLADCEACHSGSSEVLPAPDGAITTLVTANDMLVPGDKAIRTPSQAACTGCHDGDDTFTHTRLNSIIDGPEDWGEACSVCHGPGQSEDAAAAHARS